MSKTSDKLRDPFEVSYENDALDALERLLLITEPSSRDHTAAVFAYNILLANKWRAEMNEVGGVCTGASSLLRATLADLKKFIDELEAEKSQ